MVVSRENHAFRNGGLDHSAKKLTFPRHLSLFYLFFFSRKGGEGSFWDGDGVRGHATLPLICMIKNLKRVCCKSRNFDAGDGNYVIIAIAFICHIGL